MFSILIALPHQEEVVKIEVDDDTELQLALKKARRLKQMPSDKLHNKLPVITYSISIFNLEI